MVAQQLRAMGYTMHWGDMIPGDAYYSTNGSRQDVTPFGMERRLDGTSTANRPTERWRQTERRLPPDTLTPIAGRLSELNEYDWREFAGTARFREGARGRS